METTNQPEWDYFSVGLLQSGLVWPSFFCLASGPSSYINLVAAMQSDWRDIKDIKTACGPWTIMGVVCIDNGAH